MAVLLLLGLLQGIIHLWRHTAFFDGALHTIMPKFLHGIL